MTMTSVPCQNFSTWYATEVIGRSLSGTVNVTGSHAAAAQLDSAWRAKVGYGDVLPYTPAEYLVCTSCLALVLGELQYDTRTSCGFLRSHSQRTPNRHDDQLNRVGLHHWRSLRGDVEDGISDGLQQRLERKLKRLSWVHAVLILI